MEEYLKILLEQIRCKKARPYIRQELQDHMEDQIEENIRSGMNCVRAEKEAVKDMGDPVETGISLDRIHKPQAAWKLIVIVIIISAVGIFVQIMIARHAKGEYVSASGRYVIHVMLGIAVMIFLYFLDYTILARFSRIIASGLIVLCLVAVFSGNMVNGMIYYIGIGGRPVSVQALMLFYVPVYGGIIYKYHGSGYAGLMKSIAWMILPVILVLRLPSLTTAGMLMVSMLVILTIAIQKGWFHIQKKKAICGLWGIFTILPAAVLFIMYFGHGMMPYQQARIQAFFAGREENPLKMLMNANKFVGSSGTEVSMVLPEFNRDYILSYLSSMYGMIAGILICCVLAVLIIAVFNTAVKQKNQLGMIMGCGCGMIFLVSFLVNVLENIGIFPSFAAFLPFISAGGSYIIVSYGLMGVVLSIYRYKNVYPRHVKISGQKRKSTAGL